MLSEISDEAVTKSLERRSKHVQVPLPPAITSYHRVYFGVYVCVTVLLTF
jgi:hypothetical protein